VAKDAVVEIDLGKLAGNLAGFLAAFCGAPTRRRESAPAREQKRRQKQEEDDAEIGIVAEMAKELDQPIADHGHAGGVVMAPPARLMGLLPKNSAGRTQPSRNR
jgi:DNA polymerase III alpha subunit